MSKILKAIILGAYGAVIIQFIKILGMNREIENIEINYIFRSVSTFKKNQRELNKYGKNLSAILANYKKPERLPTDFKFILKYTYAYAHYTSSVYQNGQGAFIENNCSYINCFLTNDRSLLLDVRNFDAVLFDVENVWDSHPILRAGHQKYIFTAAESSDNYPICDDAFDGYFNWTWTYRLDSDIRWTYISIVDTNNTVVGPKVDMTWIENMAPFPYRLKKYLTKKKKMAAWFVSNCRAKSNRSDTALAIQRYLSKNGYEVDTFGLCGSKICPRERMDECLEIMQEEYYFYFAFENSMSEDYVTEKLLHAINYYTVPVVYGGANYSRFLPPGSYIDAVNLGPEVVASLMMEAVNYREKYEEYFRFHNHYIYKEIPQVSDVCRLCQLLQENHDTITIKKDFRKWWNPNFDKICV